MVISLTAEVSIGAGWISGVSCVVISLTAKVSITAFLLCPLLLMTAGVGVVTSNFTSTPSSVVKTGTTSALSSDWLTGNVT